MRTKKQGWLLGLVGLLALTGCQGGLRSNRSIAMAEPGLAGLPDGAGDPTLVPGNPARTVRWYDRHPMFRKPMEVYQNTNHGPVVKGAAATVVGVPTGIVGEMVQIVRGCPPGF